jgi:hypothetical protein
MPPTLPPSAAKVVSAQPTVIDIDDKELMVVKTVRLVPPLFFTSPFRQSTHRSTENVYTITNTNIFKVEDELMPVIPAFVLERGVEFKHSTLYDAEGKAVIGLSWALGAGNVTMVAKARVEGYLAVGFQVIQHILAF